MDLKFTDRKIYGAGIVVLALAFLVQIGSTLFVSSDFNADAAFVLLIASMSILVLLLPFLTGYLQFDLFSPLVLITGAFLMGTGWRIPFILYHFGESPRAQFLLYGSNFETMAGEAIWFFIGACSLTLGYTLTKKRLDFEKLPFWSRYSFNWSKLRLFSLIFGAVGCVFGVLFLASGGVQFNLSVLTSAQKIHLSSNSDVGIIAQLSRFFASWANFPFIALASMAAIGIGDRSAASRILLIPLAITVVFIPFLASSRSGLIIVLMSIAIVMYYYGKISAVRFMVFLGLIFLMIAIMGQMRATNKGLDFDRGGVVAGVIGSGNGVDMARTLGIIKNVPERVDYKYGATYPTLLTFWVPRAFWPDKPEVGLGPYIKSEVLGGREVDKNGWPAGVIGEAHLNFGKAGIVIIMFIYGAFQRCFYNSFRPYLGKNFIITLLYAVCVWRFSFMMTSSNFAHGMTGLLISIIPLFVFLALCRSYKS